MENPTETTPALPPKIPPMPTRIEWLKAQWRVLPARFRAAAKAFKQGPYRLLVRDVVFDTSQPWRREGNLVVGPNGSAVGVLPSGLPVIILNGLYLTTLDKGQQMQEALRRIEQRHAKAQRRRKR